MKKIMTITVIGAMIMAGCTNKNSPSGSRHYDREYYAHSISESDAIDSILHRTITVASLLRETEKNDRIQYEIVKVKPWDTSLPDIAYQRYHVEYEDTFTAKEDGWGPYHDTAYVAISIDIPKETKERRDAVMKWLLRQIPRDAVTDITDLYVTPKETGVKMDDIDPNDVKKVGLQVADFFFHQAYTCDMAFLGGELSYTLYLEAKPITKDLLSYVKHSSCSWWERTEEVVTYDMANKEEVDWDYLFKPHYRKEVEDLLFREIMEDNSFMMEHDSIKTLDDVRAYFEKKEYCQDMYGHTVPFHFPRPGLIKNNVIFSFRQGTIMDWERRTRIYTIRFEDVRPYLTDKAKEKLQFAYGGGYDYTMPQELSEADLKDIRQGIRTADNLKDVFLFQRNPKPLQEINPKAYRLMEKVMQRSVNYKGDKVYAHEWICEDTVRRYMLEYLQAKNPSITKMDAIGFQKVMNDIKKILEPYNDGTEVEMNDVAFVEMNFSAYLAIRTYKELISLNNDTALTRAYFHDYAYWIDLFNATNNYFEAGYLMYSYEINTYGDEMLRFRATMLREEMALLRNGSKCDWDTEAHPIDWSVKEAVLLRPWYDQRMEQSKHLSDRRFAEAFKKMTDKIAFLYLQDYRFSVIRESDAD